MTFFCQNILTDSGFSHVWNELQLESRIYILEIGKTKLKKDYTPLLMILKMTFKDECVEHQSLNKNVNIDNMLNGVSSNREMSINLMTSIEENVLKSVGLCKCM